MATNKAVSGPEECFALAPEQYHAWLLGLSMADHNLNSLLPSIQSGTVLALLQGQNQHESAVPHFGLLDLVAGRVGSFSTKNDGNTKAFDPISQARLGDQTKSQLEEIPTQPHRAWLRIALGNVEPAATAMPHSDITF